MHKNADLDALASAYYLKEIYGDALIVSHGLDRYAKNAARVLNVEVRGELADYDEVIVVDTASREQLGKFRDLRIDAVYDHHESNNIEAEKRYVDPSYPSCAEFVYHIHQKIPSRKASLLLLSGIVSDTQWFKHANRRTLSIAKELSDAYGIEMNEILTFTELPVNYGEKISLLKGFQRLIYRSVGDKIVIATRVSANESLVATQLLSYGDLVFVGSSREKSVRIIGRSKNLNLLELFARLSKDFSCTFGGHRNAAGMSCTGDLEAILNACIKLSTELLKE